MKKIKALLMTLLSLSVVGAASGCSFDAFNALFEKTSDSSTPSANESPSDTGSSDASTDDTTDGSTGNTPDDGGDVTPDVPVVEVPGTPISGDGSYDAPYVIETGKIYTVAAAEQEAAWGYVAYAITPEENGTLTLDLKEEQNVAPVYVDIAGLSAPMNEDFEPVYDGWSFSVAAGTTVQFSIYSSLAGTEETDWMETYCDASFSLSFDKNTYEADGSAFAPITVANGETYTVGETNVYYTFTAPSAGYYKLTVNGDWSNVEYGFNFYDADDNTFLRGAAVAIAEGETISFYASNSSWNDSWTELLVSNWTFSFGAELENDDNYDVPPVVGSYELPFDIDATGDYEITIPATFDGYYANLNGAFQFVVPTGVVVEANYENFFAGDVIAFTDYNEMWNNQLMLCFHIEDRTATEPLTVTISVSDYVAEEAPTEGFIEVTTTSENTYGWEFDTPNTFTAAIAGVYTFNVPAGLGFFSQAQKDLGWGGAPEIDYNMSPEGGAVEVTLAAGEEYVFYVGSTIAVEGWMISYSVSTDIEGGDDEGDVVSTVLTVGSNSVVLTDENYQDGTTYTFTPDAAGVYTFASGDVRFQVLHPMGLQMGSHMMPQISLEAGITYNVLIAGLAAGNYTLTITAPESGEDSSGEPDGTERNPFVIESLPTTLAIKYSGTGLVHYTYTATADVTCTLTFEMDDTWLEIYDTDSVIWSGSDGHSTTTYTISMVAGETYDIGIGTWSEDGTAQTINVILSI